MTQTHGTGDDSELYNMETYALAALIGCAFFTLVPVILSLIIWAVVAWG